MKSSLFMLFFAFLINSSFAGSNYVVSCFTDEKYSSLEIRDTENFVIYTASLDVESMIFNVVGRSTEYSETIPAQKITVYELSNSENPNEEGIRISTSFVAGEKTGTAKIELRGYTHSFDQCTLRRQPGYKY